MGCFVLLQPLWLQLAQKKSATLNNTDSRWKIFSHTHTQNESKTIDDLPRKIFLPKFIKVFKSRQFCSFHLSKLIEKLSFEDQMASILWNVLYAKYFSKLGPMPPSGRRTETGSSGQDTVWGGYILEKNLEKPTWNHEKPWKPTKNHEKPWNYLEKPWKPTKNHEKPWNYVTWPTRGPNWPPWLKKRDVTHTGSQPTF